MDASTSASASAAKPAHSETDLAIIGMAVNPPDAPDIDALWDSLMQGVNSCSEVSGSVLPGTEVSGIFD